MKRFGRDEEGSAVGEPSDRLVRFLETTRNALGLPAATCAALQGELLVILDEVVADYFQNGLYNYYATDHVSDLVFVLDTLIDNRNGGLDEDDVVWLRDLRPLLVADSARNQRIDALEAKAEAGLASEEAEELARLHDEDDAKGFLFEELFDRAERCIANWCIANPELVDRMGRVVSVRGVERLPT